MKTAEETLEKNINEGDLNFMFHDKKELYNEIIKAMKSYAEEALKEAAEKAKVKETDSTGIVWMVSKKIPCGEGHIFSVVKESITNIELK